MFSELKDYFEIIPNEARVTITLRTPIPEQSIPNDRIILLEIQASAPQTLSAHASVVITNDVDVTAVVELIFSQTFYTGTYTDTAGLTFITPISLTDGFDADVRFTLEGGQLQYFVQNALTALVT